MLHVIWNPKAGASDNEDCVILYSHQHSQIPHKILGYFKTSQQTGDLEATFSASNFDLPFLEAFEKAKAFAEVKGIKKLIVVDPNGLGKASLENR